MSPVFAREATVQRRTLRHESRRNEGAMGYADLPDAIAYGDM